MISLLRACLASRGISLRALGRATGVSHSSVSRLLAGRARPTPGRLRAIAPALGCPAEALLAAAGLGRSAAADDPWDTPRRLGVAPAPPALVVRVAQRLERPQACAATTAAVETVRTGLEVKLAASGAGGPVIERPRALGRHYLDGTDAPVAARHAAGSAVLSFLLAMDAIDDFLFPLGHLDDAIAIARAEAKVRRLLGYAP